MPARILVTGNAGSGKTTTARLIGEILDRQVIGLDSVLWRADWKMINKIDRQQAELTIANQDQWIVDGVSTTIREAADLVIFLDYSPWRCGLRCVRRNWRYLFRSRPGLPENCPEIKIIWPLIKIIINFPRTVRPQILKDGMTLPAGKEFVHIRRQEDLNSFLNSLKIRYNRIERTAGAGAH